MSPSPGLTPDAVLSAHTATCLLHSLGQVGLHPPSPSSKHLSSPTAEVHYTSCNGGNDTRYLEPPTPYSRSEDRSLWELEGRWVRAESREHVFAKSPLRTESSETGPCVQILQGGFRGFLCHHSLSVGPKTKSEASLCRNL